MEIALESMVNVAIKSRFADRSSMHTINPDIVAYDDGFSEAWKVRVRQTRREKSMLFRFSVWY